MTSFECNADKTVPCAACAVERERGPVEECDAPGIETVYFTALKAADALCPTRGHLGLHHRRLAGYEEAYKAFKEVADSCVPSCSEADPAIQKLAKIVQPVVRQSEKLFFIKKVDLFRQAFTWDPQVTEEATGLRVLGFILTLHRYGYYGMFKPSVAEVLSQLPADLLAKGVVAFEVEGPETAEDLNEELLALDAGFHVSHTVLYVKVQPE